MLLLAEMIPAAADSLSKLGIFFNVLIIEMVFMIFMMCYVARMYNKSVGDKPISHWMRTYIFENLSYKLFVRERKTEKGKEGYPMEAVIEEGESVSEKSTDSSVISSRKVSVGFSKFKQMGKSVIKQNVEEDIKNGTTRRPSFSSMADTVTQLMKRKNDLMVAQLNEERKEKRFFYEWRICAITMDRVCLIVFTLLFLVTTLAIFSDF